MRPFFLLQNRGYTIGAFFPALAESCIATREVGQRLSCEMRRREIKVNRWQPRLQRGVHLAPAEAFHLFRESRAMCEIEAGFFQFLPQRQPSGWPWDYSESRLQFGAHLAVISIIVVSCAWQGENVTRDIQNGRITPEAIWRLIARVYGIFRSALDAVDSVRRGQCPSLIGAY